MMLLGKEIRLTKICLFNISPISLFAVTLYLQFSKKPVIKFRQKELEDIIKKQNSTMQFQEHSEAYCNSSEEGTKAVPGDSPIGPSILDLATCPMHPR